MTQILGGVISLFGGCDSPLCPAIHTLDSPTNSLPDSPAHPDAAAHECAWCFDQTRSAVGKQPRLIMEDLPRDHPTHPDPRPTSVHGASTKLATPWENDHALSWSVSP